MASHQVGPVSQASAFLAPCHLFASGIFYCFFTVSLQALAQSVTGIRQETRAQWFSYSRNSLSPSGDEGYYLLPQAKPYL